MSHDAVIAAVDSHTGGEPTRVITDGLPPIPGETMTDKLAFFREHLDSFRTALVHEPRGHRDLVGAVLLPPTRDDADFGVFFMDRDRAFSMCGHATIGVGVTLVKTGRVASPDPETKVVLETPAGLVPIRIRADDDGVLRVSFQNVPAFLAADAVTLELPNRRVDVDVSFGGSFFTLVDVAQLALEIVPDNVAALVQEASSISDAAFDTIAVAHPEYPHMKQEKLVYFYSDAPAADVHGRSLAVTPSGNFDRSPCGTGTASRLAALHARGRLGVDEPYRVESVNRTCFDTRIVKETRVGEHVAIVAEITSSAFVTGRHEFMLDPADPLKNGFLL